MKLLFLTVLVSASAAAITASQVQTSPDFATRGQAAAKVVVAVVEDVQPRFDVNQYGDRLIISRALLRVDETLKGTPTSLVELDLEGGTIGELTLLVSDLPVLHSGERAVFFLTASSTNVHRPQGRGLGIVKLDASNRAVGSTSTLAEIRAAVRAAR